jgi:hypothetical protein
VWGIARLLFVSVLAVLAFALALVSFRQVPVQDCQMPAVADASYRAMLVEPPTVDGTIYHVAVTHNGQPVNGATVCFRADMGGPGGMSGMGVSNLAHQVGPGRYEILLTFQMGGPWQGRIVVEPPGEPAVETKLLIMVR